MIVYHGSYCVVKTPNIIFSRDSLDFGKGFYLTSIKTQALNWTERFKKRGKKAYLNSYSLDIDELKKICNVKIFDSYNLEWLDFILECRNMSYVYMKYDVIIGGIADDKIYNTIELYQDNLIEKDEALKRLKYYKPNEQICITNQNVIDKYLKFRCEEEV
ncbi:sortase [Clostridioides difficile]|nr:sortase [Clostridioides difficile]